MSEKTETVNSAGDARTVNNVMRHEYRVLDETEKENMQAIKDIGAAFYALLDEIAAASSNSREISLAKTKVEEAVMWGVKHITK